MGRIHNTQHKANTAVVFKKICLLGCYTVLTGKYVQTFWTNNFQVVAFFGLLDPEYGGSMLLQNVNCLPANLASHLRRLESSKTVVENLEFCN